MKKWIVGLVAVLFCVSAFGAINTSWNTVKEPHGNLAFNVNINEGTAAPPDYYPLQVKLDVPVVTADEKGITWITIYKNVGTNQPTPFNFSTIQGLKDIHTALPAFAKDAFKEAILAGLNEDVTQ